MKHHQECDAQSPDVAALVVYFGSRVGIFGLGGHVSGGATFGTNFDVFGSQPEIRYLDLAPPAEQDVLGLDVPMGYFGHVVQVIHGRCQLLEVPLAL